MDLQPGSFVRLEGGQSGCYQVVNVDDVADRCWVRRWPLPRQGSPVFSVPRQDLRGIVDPEAAAARPGAAAA